MDAAEGHRSKPGFFHKILPPRLGDAALDDCALPPNSIRQAFFKAASALKSRATALLFPPNALCVDDPWGDVVNGAICRTQKGLTMPEFGQDSIVIGGMVEKRGKACVVNGLEGLEIGDEAEKEKSSEEEKPILVEGFA